MEAKDIISIIALLVSMTSIYFTFQQYKFQRQMGYDDKLFAELSKILERAYSNIEHNSGITSDIKKWRNSARYLIQYKRLKNHIQTNIYKDICAETEEYYRSKFNNLLTESSGKNILPSIEKRLEVNYAAVATIIEFTHRNAWADDPLKNIDISNLIKNHNLFSKLTTFESFIKTNHPEYYEEIKRKINAVA